MPLFQFHLSVWFQLKIHQDSVQAIQLTWQKRKHFLTGKCPIQAIDGDIVKAIQLNHRKILDVHTTSVAVRKKGVTRSNKPFPGCLVPPAGVGAGTGNEADIPATKSAAD